jgi:hypothetical protein
MGIAPFTAQADSRTREILEDLEQVLLAFMRKHGITHEQYRVATQILVDTVKKGEESLLYDVFLEAEPTDIGNRQRAGSPEAIEGPFYLPGAPALEQPYIMPMRDGEPGEVLFSRASSRSSQDEGGFDDSILAPLMYASVLYTAVTIRGRRNAIRNRCKHGICVLRSCVRRRSRVSVAPVR